MRGGHQLKLGALVLALLAGMTGPSGAAVPGTTYAVSGVITRDGVPYPDATLTFSSRQGELVTVAPQSPDFSVQLPAGSWFLKTTGDDVFTESYDDAYDVALASSFVVSQDLTLHPIDLLPLVRPHVTGTIVDLAGERLGGAEIYARRIHATSDLPSSFTADANGDFDLPLSPGDYAFSFGDKAHAFEWYSDEVNYREAEAVRVTKSASLGTITLSDQSVSGRVTRPDGTGIPEITVHLVAVTADGQYDATRTGYTDAQGYYTVAHVPHGSWNVGFSDPIYDDFVEEWYDDRPLPQAGGSLEVVEGEAMVGVDAELAHVLDPGDPRIDVAGTVTDIYGRPVPNAQMFASLSPRLPPPDDHPIEVVADTDRDGHYYLTGLDASSTGTPLNRFKILAAPIVEPRGQPETETFRPVPTYVGNVTQRELATDVVVPAGSRVDDVDIDMLLSGGIRGRIRSTSGASNTDVYGHATVYAVDTGRSDYTELSHGGNGTYSIVGLLPGERYRVYVQGQSTTDNVGFRSWFPRGSTYASGETLTVPTGGYLDLQTIDAARTLQNLIAPTITGAPREGDVLAGDPGTWEISGLDFTLTWLADGVVVDTGPTHTVTAAEVGKQMTLRVLAVSPILVTNPYSLPLTAIQDSLPTAAVVPLDGLPPQTLTPPIISPPVIPPPVATDGDRAPSVTKVRGEYQAGRDRIRLTIRVVVEGKARASGSVVLRWAGHATRRVPLENGKAVVLLVPRRARNVLTAVYPGAEAVAPSRDRIVVLAS